jgi:hypothetical protein
VRLTITGYTEPDHPWSADDQVMGWCLTCGEQQITHDGNLVRTFDAMETAGRIADECWWYVA